jgi:hypothetical protein
MLMKPLLILFLFCIQFTYAQQKVQLTKKVSLSVNANIETYFFAEKLAVERIDYFVFDHKGWDYAHEPIVHFGFEHFKKFKDKPVIIRLASLFKQIRDSLHDNGPIMNHLLNQKEFPQHGPRFSGTKQNHVFKELTDSLRSFYLMAKVGDYLKINAYFYKNALQEVKKDINIPAFSFMEQWYGKSFPEYQLSISPAMPITKGEDNYRGFGPLLESPKGKIPAMVISPSRMLDLQPDLNAYQAFGYDNPDITRFLTSHEIGHAFVNPELEAYTDQIKAHEQLYTPELEKLLKPKSINNWHVCVIEHLVRLAEIRVAVLMKDPAQADYLRKLHIGEYGCVLLPLLEDKIKEYEQDRKLYPGFKQYLPVLVAYLHSLSLELINEQVSKYKDYPKH